MILWIGIVLVALGAKIQSLDAIDPEINDENLSVMNQITQVDLNNLFDKSLPLIQKMIIKGGLDPLNMPDQILSISDIPGLNPMIHLQRGWVQETETIKRSGDVIVRYGGKVIEFDAALGWNHLDATYTYTLRYFLFTRKGTFNGRFDDVKVQLLGSFDLNTRKINLRFFKITGIGGFSLKIHGHLLDHVLNAFTKVVTIFSRDLVVREIEYRFELALQDKIKEVNDLIPEPYSFFEELLWNYETDSIDLSMDHFK
ncbi:uncharacterized protein [Fopius arisanus]|uniref:Uncharacterized protein n=1 Tax=Fopius arisanus TaxID=64838 RepID=A0A9R1TV61_9HYME|nr:PREDICTED: uncharacterized protein LOC105264152 [Fopius arisanus]